MSSYLLICVGKFKQYYAFQLSHVVSLPSRVFITINCPIVY